MKYLRFLYVSLLLLAALAASGCMSVRDPQIARQTGSVEVSTASPPSVLLIFQVNLERRSFMTTTAEKADALYHLAGPAFVKRIEAMGGKAEYKVSSELVPLEVPRSGHTHVSIQKITQLSVDGYGNSWYRVWDSSLFVLDRTAEGKPPRRAVNQVYSSDGIRCFSGSQYANRVDCQVKYIDHLVAQVAPIFPAK